MTESTIAGNAYDAELIGEPREEFSLEDYDAEAAANEAAKDVPSLSRLAWQMKNAADHEANQEGTP
jgi:hypothetical protein